MADSVQFSFELTGSLDSAVTPLLRTRLASIQRQIANQARADVPVLTGNLGRTIRERSITQPAPLIVEGGVDAGGRDAPYAPFVHQGTRPHVIMPRNARALRFEVGGRTVFARRVNHPGTRARPFLKNAADRVIAREVAPFTGRR